VSFSNNSLPGELSLERNRMQVHVRILTKLCP